MQLVKAMLDGKMSVALRARFGVADVRDVADLHVRTMAAPGAAGKRFLAVADGPTLNYLEVAETLRRRFSLLAARVPTVFKHPKMPRPTPSSQRLRVHRTGQSVCRHEKSRQRSGAARSRRALCRVLNIPARSAAV